MFIVADTVGCETLSKYRLLSARRKETIYKKNDLSSRQMILASRRAG